MAWKNITTKQNILHCTIAQFGFHYVLLPSRWVLATQYNMEGDFFNRFRQSLTFHSRIALKTNQSKG